MLRTTNDHFGRADFGVLLENDTAKSVSVALVGLSPITAVWPLTTVTLPVVPLTEKLPPPAFIAHAPPTSAVPQLWATPRVNVWVAYPGGGGGGGGGSGEPG